MKVHYSGGEFELNDRFVLPLNTICHNLKSGWDFVILITSSGYGRAGKTTFGGQIGAFCAERLGTPFSVDNVVFGSNAMIDTALKLPKMSVIMNDESREDLSSKRSMETMSKEIMDFFNECGVLNHLYILIATDFFDFNSNIAKTRSEMLFNLSRKYGTPFLDNGLPTMDIKRGRVQFFDRVGKAEFYDFCRKNKNYADASKYAQEETDAFSDTFVFDRAEYDARKAKFLRRNRTVSVDTTKEINLYTNFYVRLYKNWVNHGNTIDDLSEKTGISVWALKKNYNALLKDKGDTNDALLD